MKYRLTSIGLKINSLLALLGCMTLAVLSTIYRERVPLYGMIFIWIIVAVLLFSLFVLFRHIIVLNYKKRKIIFGGDLRMVVHKSIDIDDILSIIAVNDMSKRLSMIEVKLKNGKNYRTGGYISVFRGNDGHITERIVAQLNEQITQLRSSSL